MIQHRYMVGALALLLVSASSAQAQLDDLLKQVLPGATQQQNSGDAADQGERACERYAEGKGLDVQRVLETRPSGSNNLEVTLRVANHNESYEARCVYDTGDREVRGLETVSGTTQALDRDRDRDNGEVGERLARRAEDACEDLARQRDYSDIGFDDVRSHNQDTVEVDMRARLRGNRVNITCLYDDDQRHALFTD